MEEKPHYLGHRKRVREKFVKFGGGCFADYEILELMLFSAKPREDVKPLAKRLLAKFGSLPKVLNAGVGELAQLEGMGEAAVVALKVAHEASLRLLKEEIEKKSVLGSWKALLEYCQVSMGHNKTEQFRIFFLDLKNRLIADELQQKGTVDHTPVYPREVIKRALELGATSIILAHNHPSGDPEPSKADIDMTRKIMLAAMPVNIQLHDHLIIGSGKHYSFKANGLI